MFLLFSFCSNLKRMVMSVMEPSMRVLTTSWCSVTRLCKHLCKPWGRLDNTWRVAKNARRKSDLWFVKPPSLGRTKGKSRNCLHRKKRSLRRGRGTLATSTREPATGHGKRSGVCSRDASSATTSEFIHAMLGLFSGLPCFCSLVCVWYNTRK